MAETPATWTVWRIDDNANTFIVRSGLPRDEAERVAAEFTSHGHKQTYWVEPDEINEHNPAPRATSDTIGPQRGPVSVRQIEAQTKQANRELRGLGGGG